MKCSTLWNKQTCYACCSTCSFEHFMSSVIEKSSTDKENYMWFVNLIAKIVINAKLIIIIIILIIIIDNW